MGAEPDMRGIFYAMGPAFKRGHVHQWIKMVDEYQILADITGTKTESHRGDWERVEGMMLFSRAATTITTSAPIIIAILCHIASM
jgi:hypothetical protein